MFGAIFVKDQKLGTEARILHWCVYLFVCEGLSFGYFGASFEICNILWVCSVQWACSIRWACSKEDKLWHAAK